MLKENIYDPDTLDHMSTHEWVPRVPHSEAEKIICGIDALNRSLDKILDRIAAILSQLAHVLERH